MHARTYARTDICTHTLTLHKFRVAKSRYNSRCLVKTPDRQFHWKIHDTHVAMRKAQATTVGRDQTGNISNLIQKILKKHLRRFKRKGQLFN